jgi:hypothetical protein
VTGSRIGDASTRLPGDLCMLLDLPA